MALVGAAVAAWCGSFAQGAPGVNLELGLEEKRALLDAHNAKRRLWAKGGQGIGHPVAAGIQEMFWDPGLEAMAKKRAAHCYYGHFGGSGAINADYKEIKDKVSYGWTSPLTAGENVALFKNNEDLFTESPDRTKYVTNAVDSWAAEGDLFDWKKKICYADTCGHWSQVLSTKTRYIGCAAASCPDGIVGAPGEWKSGVVVQCNYWPPMDDGYPYLDGLNDLYASICLGCSYYGPWDSYICDDYLCTGGINPLYHQSQRRNETVAQCHDGLGRPLRVCTQEGNFYTPAPAPTEVPSTATPAPLTHAPADAAHTECPEAVRVASFWSADTFDQNAPLTFGGNFLVTGTASVGLLTRDAPMFNFGNGAAKDNVVVHQYQTTGHLTLSVLVGTRWQSISCPRHVPLSGSFTFEASVIDGHGALYVNGKLCAEGPVAAPRLVQRNINLIGKAHPNIHHKGTDGQLNGELSSFQLHMCGPHNAVPSATPLPDAVPTAVPSTATPAPPTTAVPNTAAPAPPTTAVPNTATPAPPTTAAPSTATPVPPPVATPPAPVDPAHTECPEAVRVVSFQSADTFDQNAPLTFGGNFRVTARVLINTYGRYARVFDFGNGRPRDNVLVTQHGSSGKLSLFVFVGTRSHSITCDRQAPLGRTFAFEASVLNGKAAMYVDGALCAQGPVAAPPAVQRNGNLIGLSHWSHDSPLDGEVTSFELDTCGA